MCVLLLLCDTRRHRTSYACKIRGGCVVTKVLISGESISVPKIKSIRMRGLHYSPFTSNGNVQRYRAFNKYIFYLIRPHDSWRDTSERLLSHCAPSVCMCVATYTPYMYLIASAAKTYRSPQINSEFMSLKWNVLGLMWNRSSSFFPFVLRSFSRQHDMLGIMSGHVVRPQKYVLIVPSLSQPSSSASAASRCRRLFEFSHFQV